jgi:filamentous hemagglutinin
LTTGLSLMDSQVSLSAAGNVKVTGVSNPTSNVTNIKSNSFRATFSTYDDSSAIQAVSLAGDTTIAGNIGDILPATLYAASPNGSTELSNVTLYPSSTGNLTLLAEKNANISNVVMSDVDPANITKVTTVNLKANTSPNLSNYIGSSGHTQGLLFTKDTEPVRIYANQDVNFTVASPLITSKKIEVLAGHDVVDANVIIQNNYANDVSIIQAGHDVRYTTPQPQADGTYLPVNAGIQVAGPGRLHVVSGRDVDLGVSNGIRSIGATNNPYLPEQGADLMVQAGAASVADYAAMIHAYLDSSSPYSSAYLPLLLEEMKKRTGNTGLTSDQALVEFKALDKPAQAAFINVIYFNELKVSGRNAINPKSSEYGDYSRAERAILTMFPDFAQPSTTQSLLAQSGSIMNDFGKIKDETLTHTGNLSLFNSQIRSERGGRIELLVPQGLINAGLEVSGGVAKPDTDLGITSLRGGELLGMVRNDFQVNQSRVFTLGGSDLLLYSALADIDAGKGSKTASSTPPPVIRIVNGQVVFDYSGAVTGSGIAALTATGGKPGTVDLFAPYGEINAGEAGIRSAGNINLGARVIVGADNIVAGGTTSGVPAVSSSGLSIAAPASADSSASGQQGSQLADANKQDMGNKLATLPSIISVEVISLGDDSVDSASKPNAKRCDKSDKSRKDCTD